MNHRITYIICRNTWSEIEVSYLIVWLIKITSFEGLSAGTLVNLTLK